MTRKLTLLLAAVAFAAAVMAGCKRPVTDPDPEEETAELQPLQISVPMDPSRIFSETPTFVIRAENPNKKAVTADAKIRIVTDTRVEVETFTSSAEVAAAGTADIEMNPSKPLDPGFYRASFFVNGKSAGGFVFGISPFDIVSAPDMQDDFEAFWTASKKQLTDLDMNARLVEIPSRSSDARKVYFVEFQSVPDGLTGDPVTVRGYYLEPMDGQKHPVLMHFFGYDEQKPSGKLSCPSGGSNAQFAEFYLSHRGQYINNRKASQRSDGIDEDFTNIYGDWFAFHFGNRDGYYYRGAFLDCVQAIRFMATRPTSDMNNIFAEGSSQGGALSYAAAALSPYPLRAIAPCVAFLGDYPDYFRIVSWPGDVAKKNIGSMTDAEMYAFLSYFDTKNLATLIHCSVIACSGLMDETCPPHTNTAPFNNLPVTDKEMYYYPKMKHEIPSGWDSKYMQFFKERIQ